MENKDYYDEYYSIREETINLYKVKVPNKYENFEKFLEKEGLKTLFKNSIFAELEDVIKSDPCSIVDINGDKVSKEVIEEAISKDK